MAQFKHAYFPIELHSYLVQIKAKYNLESIHAAMTFICRDRMRLKKEIKLLKDNTMQNEAINRPIEVNVP
jgi:hypothetical protein